MSKRSTWRISTVLSLGGLQLSAASLSAVSISTIAHNTDRRSIFGLWKIQLQLFRSYCWPLLPSEAPWIASHQPTKPHPSLRAGSSPPLSTMAQMASTRGATMDKIMSTWWIDINTTKTASDIETLLSKTHFLTSSTVPKCNLTFLICWMRTAAKKMPFFDIDPQHLIQQGHPARPWHVDDTVEFETRNYRGEAQTTSGLIVVEGRSATDSAWAHELALPILWSKKMWWCHEHPTLLSSTRTMAAPRLTRTQIAEDFSWRSCGLKQPSHRMNEPKHHNGWSSGAIWIYVRIGFCLLKKVKNLCSA